MPVKVQKRGMKYRVVNSASGKIEKTPLGEPRDGGGHASQAKADAQVRGINSKIKKKKR